MMLAHTCEIQHEPKNDRLLIRALEPYALLNASKHDCCI